ncbi:zinc-ribbon domain-containing protein [Dysosmobacter sp.]
MAYCGKCGAKIENGTKFCPACGASTEIPKEETTQTPDYSAKLQELNNTVDSTAQFEAGDIQQNKVMAILAYFGVLVLIPLFGAKTSRFARYHTNQGLTLFIVEIAWSIVYSILSKIILAISWRLYFLVNILGLVSLVFLVLAVIGIVNAANGRAKELPVIGGIQFLK